MALITSTFPNISGNKPAQYHYVMWSAMLNLGWGSASKIMAADLNTVQVYGTFGTGGSVTMRGSLKDAPDPAVPADWFNLTDPQGVAVTFTAAGGKRFQECPLWISPLVTAGDGTTSLNVLALSLRRH